ncbi:hypothetical protein BD408DRAFT_342385, partial [Parasitella parasitica]
FAEEKVCPCIQGSVPHSIIIDISNALDNKQTFIVDLSIFCKGNVHIWAISDKLIKDHNRLYAEITVSPQMYHQFLRDPTLKLENFDKPFMAYPSLSPSANIVKLSLSQLPHQYGGQQGKEQLQEDMRFNLNEFGDVLSCGIVFGGSGSYTGGGYAVLANWNFQLVDFISKSNDLSDDRESVLIHAMWAAMPPFCKYCHSMDHALIDCTIRKKKFTCDLCS